MNTNAPDSKTGSVPIEDKIEEFHTSLDRSRLVEGRKAYGILVNFSELADNEPRFADLMGRLAEVAEAVHSGTEHRKGLDEQVAYDLLVGLPAIGFEPFKAEGGDVIYQAVVRTETGTKARFVAALRLPQDHLDSALEVVPTTYMHQH